MRFFIAFFFTLFFVSSGHAEITGISSKTSLLQQLQLSLGITIQQAGLPASLVSKLPLTNQIEEIKPSFLAAWTQTTFFSCKRAIELGEVPQLSDKTEIKNWVRQFSLGSWGMEASASEVESLYGAAFIDNAFETEIHKMSLLCGLILASPKVYVIYNKG